MNGQVLQGEVRNRLLKSLPEDDFEILAADLEFIRLPLGGILELPGEPVDFAIFIETGIASLLVEGKDSLMTETGHVGFEGITGRAVVYGSPHATRRIQMQVGGHGFTIPSGSLGKAMRDRDNVRTMVLKYLQASDIQSDHTLVAATSYTIVERLARWLLMYHDRIDGDDFPVTHEILSVMLNVRRAGVTGAVHVLEGEHAIRAKRGGVHIANRSALVRLAAGSYGIPEAAYEQIFVTLPRETEVR
jgi:CRP-like cAMP-binding protein